MNSLSSRPKASKGTIILAIIIALILTGVFSAYFFFRERPSEFDRQLKDLVQKIQATDEDQSFVDTVKKRLNDVSETKDEKNQYKYLSQIAFGAGAQYNTFSHNPKLREFLESFDTFVSKYYPNLYKKADFYVPCSDQQCSTLTYPAEIIELKKQIEQSDLGLNKQSILDALYNAAIAKPEEKERQFVSYFFVLQILQREASNDNKAAKKLAGDLKVFLEKNFPNQFKKIQDQDPTRSFSP